MMGTTPPDKDDNAAALKAMTAERDAAIATADKIATEARDAAMKAREDAEKDLDFEREVRKTAEAALETANTANAGLILDLAEVSTQRDAQLAEIAKLKKKPAVTPAPKPAPRRKIGPVEGLVDSDLVFEMVKAEPHEIVFSDGREEIAALPPVMASAEAWQRTGAGTMLITPITVCPNMKVDLAGFGLVDDKGVQIAWCAMSQPVAIAAGQAVRLDRQIIF